MRYIVEVTLLIIAAMMGAAGLLFMSLKAIMVGMVFAIMAMIILAVRFFVEMAKDEARNTCSFNPKLRYQYRQHERRPWYRWITG